MFLPKKNNQILDLRKHETKQNKTKNILQNNWLENFRSLNIMKVKERLISDWGKLKRDDNLIQSRDSVPDAFTIKDIFGRIGKIWVGSEDWTVVRYQC